MLTRYLPMINTWFLLRGKSSCVVFVVPGAHILLFQISYFRTLTRLAVVRRSELQVVSMPFVFLEPSLMFYRQGFFHWGWSLRNVSSHPLLKTFTLNLYSHPLHSNLGRLEARFKGRNCTCLIPSGQYSFGLCLGWTLSKLTQTYGLISRMHLFRF